MARRPLKKRKSRIAFKKGIIGRALNRARFMIKGGVRL